MKLAKLVHIIIVAIIALSSCKVWIDHQFDALDCCYPKWQMWEVECQNKTLYVCRTSCRWEKLFSCDEIQEVVDYIQYYDTPYHEYYKQYLQYNLDCCMEE